MTTASPIAALLNTDGYKLDHRRQYPAGTTLVYSNYTNRSSRIPGVDHVVHFGLQAALQTYLVEAFEPFFAADENEVAALYFDFIAAYLGPDAADAIGVDHIVALHQLGYLPLLVKSAPEGTLLPLRVPSFTIENTIPEFFWLVNYVETVVSAEYWHTATSATIALQYRRILDAAAINTGGAMKAVDFQAHDFSYRGQTSTASAAKSGAAHLTSFLGTDSLPALEWIRRYYPGDNGLVGAGVPATEHSVMCAGLQDGELDTFNRLLDLYPSGILSVVSDTWDLWNVLDKILPQLSERILARDGKLVIRPDSGDPETILCGDIYAPTGSPRWHGVVGLLDKHFGSTPNVAGFLELNEKVGAIYGDSITPERAYAITLRLESMGFASTNVVFGVGSYSYQGTTRDTFGSAVKATYVEIDGEGHNLQKDPVTDSGLKKSATGRLAVVADNNGGVELVQDAGPEAEAISLLQPVWQDGKNLAPQAFHDVRTTLTRQL